MGVQTLALQKAHGMGEAIVVAIFECNLPQATEQFLEDCVWNANNVEQTPHYLD